MRFTLLLDMSREFDFSRRAVLICRTLGLRFVQHLRLSIVYTGMEIGLFQQLAAQPDRTQTAAELAAKTGASPELLGKADCSMWLMTYN
jgi:hypothetical protein